MYLSRQISRGSSAHPCFLHRWPGCDFPVVVGAYIAVARHGSGAAGEVYPRAMKYHQWNWRGRSRRRTSGYGDNAVRGPNVLRDARLSAFHHALRHRDKTRGRQNSFAIQYLELGFSHMRSKRGIKNSRNFGRQHTSPGLLGSSRVRKIPRRYEHRRMHGDDRSRHFSVGEWNSLAGANEPRPWIARPGLTEYCVCRQLAHPVSPLQPFDDLNCVVKLLVSGIQGHARRPPSVSWCQMESSAASSCVHQGTPW